MEVPGIVAEGLLQSFRSGANLNDDWSILLDRGQHGEVRRRTHAAHEHVDLVARDHFDRDRGGSVRFALGVRDHQLNLPAEQATGLVDLIGCELDALLHLAAQIRDSARNGQWYADPYGAGALSADRQRRKSCNKWRCTGELGKLPPCHRHGVSLQKQFSRATISSRFGKLLAFISPFGRICSVG